MKVPSTNDKRPMELRMTPMIDVVFLLLVFFVWTSSFELPEFDLPSSIAETPSSGAAINSDPQTSEPFDEIVIGLAMDQSKLVITFGDQVIDGPRQVRTRIAEIVALGVQPPVIIDPADDITMKFAIQIYDAARQGGADRVLFAADP